MTDYRDFKRYTDNWYFLGLPKVYNTEPFDSSFASAIRKNVNILIDSAKTEIKFVESETAYTDLKRIYLPVFPLQYDALQKTFGKNVDIDTKLTDYRVAVVTTLYDLFILHESSHIVHTDRIVKDNKLAQLIDNLLEDYYIDTIESINYSIPYALGGELLVGLPQKDEIINLCNQLNEIYDNEKRLDYELFMDLLLKIRLTSFFTGNYEYGNLFDVNFVKDYYYDAQLHKDILNYFSYTNKEFAYSMWNNRERRINLSLRIAQMLQNETPEGEELAKEKAYGDNTDSDSLGELLESILSDELSDEQLKELAEQAEKIVESFNEQLKELKKDEKQKIVRTKGDEHFKITDVYEVDVLKHLNYTYDIEMDNRFLSFANKVKYFTSDNFKTSSPLDSGKFLEEKYLHNYLIDGSIFINETALTRDVNKPQTIILVDGSGSMGSLYYEVLASAMGIAYSLYTNDFPVSVFSHTGYNDYHKEDKEQILLMQVFSYKMFDVNKKVVEQHYQFKKRFQTACTIGQQQNYDGFAIGALEKYFFNDGKKNIFVLSDGQPSGFGGYGGNEAINHTKNVVEYLRKKDIYVASLSLKRGVVEANNEIYGNKYNFEAVGSNLNNVMFKICEAMIGI